MYYAQMLISISHSRCPRTNCYKQQNYYYTFTNKCTHFHHSILFHSLAPQLCFKMKRKIIWTENKQIKQQIKCDVVKNMIVVCCLAFLECRWLEIKRNEIKMPTNIYLIILTKNEKTERKKKYFDENTSNTQKLLFE